MQLDNVGMVEIGQDGGLVDQILGADGELVRVGSDLRSEALHCQCGLAAGPVPVTRIDTKVPALEHNLENIAVASLSKMCLRNH